MAETLKNIEASINGTEHEYINPQIAEEYSSSSTYAVGDYCTYQGQTYKCTTAITTAQAWTAANWTAVYVADDVASIPSELELLKDNLFQRVMLYPPMFISRAMRNASATVVDGTGYVTSAIRIILDDTDDKDLIFVATGNAGFQIYDADKAAWLNESVVYNGTYHYHGKNFYLNLCNSAGTTFTTDLLDDIYIYAAPSVAEHLLNVSVGFSCKISQTQPMVPTYGTDYGRGYYIPRYGVRTTDGEVGFLARNQTAVRPTTAALYSDSDIILAVGRDESADKIVTCTVCLFDGTDTVVSLTSGEFYTIQAGTYFSLTFSESSGAATNNGQKYTVLIVKGTVPLLYDASGVTALSVAHPANFACDAAFITGGTLLWSLAKGNTVDPPRFWVRDLATNTMLASAVDAGHTFGHCNNVNYDPSTGRAYVSDWTTGGVVHVFAVDATAYTMTYVEDITFSDHTIGSADYAVIGAEAYFVGWTSGSSATSPNTLTFGMHIADEEDAYSLSWSRKAARPNVMQGMAVVNDAIRYVACDFSTNNYYTLSVNDIDLATGSTTEHTLTGEITTHEGEAIIPIDDYTSMVVASNSFIYIVMVAGSD